LSLLSIDTPPDYRPLLYKLESSVAPGQPPAIVLRDKGYIFAFIVLFSNFIFSPNNLFSFFITIYSLLSQSLHHT